jgi:hypothetical protein
MGGRFWYLIVISIAGLLAAALAQHERDADNLLGLRQVVEHQAAHLSQTVTECGFDIRVGVLSSRKIVLNFKKTFTHAVQQSTGKMVR